MKLKLKYFRNFLLYKYQYAYLHTDDYEHVCWKNRHLCREREKTKPHFNTSVKLQ